MSVARDFFDLRVGGLYLPSLVLIAIRPEIQYLIPIIALSLYAAVYFHGLVRNVFGVGGPEENPMETGEAIQTMQVALTGKGPHEKMPDSIWGMYANFLSNPRMVGMVGWGTMLLFVISLIVWPIGVFTSLYYGTTQIQSLSTGSFLLVFAEWVWVLQWVIWRVFSPGHLLEKDDFDGPESDPNSSESQTTLSDLEIEEESN